MGCKWSYYVLLKRWSDFAYFKNLSKVHAVIMAYFENMEKTKK
jgi:hypothetical protein